MLRTRTMIGSGCLVTILISAGFILLMRSCLSKYDERSAKLPAIIYSDDSTAFVCTIVAFDKTTSYSSGRGMTTKTVNTTYYLQTNDINTAAKIKQKEIKDHQDIKEWPVRIMGHSSGAIWVFMGELMAFNPFTLEKITDIARLEKINPLLNGKFPPESRFYEFREKQKAIDFTATDGVRWRLDANTLKASGQPEQGEDDVYKLQMDSLTGIQNRNSAWQDSLYQKYGRQAGDDYRARKIDYETYQSLQKKWMSERTRLDLLNDQIRKSENELRSRILADAQLKSAMNSLARIDPGYTQMWTSLDTFNNQWTGIYNAKELRELAPQIYMRRAYDETARRFIVRGPISLDKNNTPFLDTGRLVAVKDVEFLDGGLLIDKLTAKPFDLGRKTILIIHKDKIGKEGSILLSATDPGGRLLWTANTSLTSWYDWQAHDGNLIIFGQNNKELTSGEANILMSINLSNGKMNVYDYFTDSRLTK